MLRPDFTEIFDVITRKSVTYTLNTNGTFITPEIANLLRRKGSKMVALYGATAEVHDYITRNPGSFEATMQGFAYLKEAIAGFIVQLIPMRQNFHQFDKMVSLAQSLSPHYRIGAAWLFFTACGSSRRNAQIARQRLDPKDVIMLDPPDVGYEDWLLKEIEPPCQADAPDERLLAQCISKRRNFHIDPYGQMTFCSFIKDSDLRYDLRTGSFQEAWDRFIPSLSERIRGGQEYLENCAVCELRADCRWCDVYGYLEHRRHGAKVEYLCQVAQENRAFKEDWQRCHRRYYEIAGITVQVEADLPITDRTFVTKFKQFETHQPGSDLISIRHHFILPDLKGQNLGIEVYRKPPWAIYRKGQAWIYLGIAPDPDDPTVDKVAVFNQDHSRGKIYHPDDEIFRRGDLHALTLFPTDQIWLARALADRQACFLHSSGALMQGQGLLFVGHSDAGKSTITRMLAERAEILCDDRNIVRRWPQGFRVYGSWSHGEVPLVSSASAPLRAVLFIQKARHNRLTHLTNRQDIIGRLLSCLIRPLATADWWEKMLTLIEILAREVPCYEIEFDLGGKIVPLIEELTQGDLAWKEGTAQ